jgi:hypothetical protein
MSWPGKTRLQERVLLPHVIASFVHGGFSGPPYRIEDLTFKDMARPSPPVFK